MLTGSGYRGPSTLRDYAILPLFAILAWNNSCWNRGGAMGARFRSWLQKNRKWLGYLFLAVVGLLVVVLVFRALLINGTGFDVTTTKTVSQATTKSQTTLTTTILYQSGKTLWDWMQLLIIPFVDAIPIVV